MKVVGLLSVATLISACSAVALAADPAAVNNGAESGSKATTAHTKKDATSLKNDRLRKCKAMQGDEKKACEKDAQADAKAVMQHANEKEAADAKPAAQSK